jgi:ubiquinone/menaquinone biosynthesis C-methylase UbiE
MLTSTNRQTQYVDPSSAQTYSNNNAVQFNQGNDFVDKYGHLIQGPVLDIGCGTGELTAHIAKKMSVPMTGIDISEARIKFASERYGGKEIKFIVGDATLLAVQQGSYKTMLSFNTLHHVPTENQIQVFLAAKKALTPDGVLVFLIPGRSPELHDAINETAVSDPWKTCFYDFDLSKVRTYQAPEYYKKLSKSAGFYDCDATAECDSGGKELDAKGMKDFLSGWLPHLAHLKIKILDDKEREVLQDKFLSDIVKLYFSKMKKEISATVNPVITQNKIVAFASKAAFFNRAKPLTHNNAPSAATVRIQSRL